MAESVENRSGDVPDSAEYRPIGRILLDAVSEAILSTILFVFRFLGWCVRWSFATLLLLGVMAAAAWFVFNQAIRGGDFVVVPDVTNWPVLAASNRLAEAGLKVGEQQAVMNDRVPEYSVIVQRPAPGKVIREGREISLTISAGRQDMPAPQLVGKNVETAIQDVHSSVFLLGSTARVPSGLPLGTVLSQDPRPSRAAKVGSEIHLLVSDGPAPGDALMPALEGRPVQVALDQLASLNVEVNTIIVNDSNLSYDTVLTQIPNPGSRLAQGESVTIEVRPLRIASLPNPRYKVDVTYEVPRTSFSPRVRVELVSESGASHRLFPQPHQLVDGLEPRLQPGTRITIPEVTFSREARIEFYADDILHMRYEYRGGAEPIRRTINQPGQPPESVARTPLPQTSPRPTVSTTPLPPAQNPDTNPWVPADPAPAARSRDVDVEVFEPRSERVRPAPRN